MDCVLLGSGGMMPMPYRFLTSLSVRYQGMLYIFDAGEGTQISVKKARVGIKNLRVIAVSHLHGDHCLGVPGLLMMKARVDEPVPLTILGPPGTESFVSQVREHLGFFINFPIQFIEWNEDAPELAYQDELVSILWAPLKHTTFCLGYRLEEHPRAGKFRPDLAGSLGVPKGPLWARLQGGEDVILEDGTRITPSQVLGKARNGRHICYAVDTQPNKALYRLCKNTDLAFLDGMFLPEHSDEAKARGHMTMNDAARVASRAGVIKTVLVHISPRYQETDMEDLERSLMEMYKETEIGKDLKCYPVSFRDR